MIELEVVNGIAKGNTLRTNAPYITIGRSQADSIVVPDAYVSWHHGEISQRDKHYRYRDLNSTHGTILRRMDAERYIDTVVLREGDELLLAGPENSVRVNAIIPGEGAPGEFTLTVARQASDEPGPPEEVLGDDSHALQTILRLDRAMQSLKSMDSNSLFTVLTEKIAEIYPELEYVAVVQESGDTVFIEHCGFQRKGARCRTSSTILRKTLGRKGGIIFEISDERVAPQDEESATLSPRSMTSAPDATGICIPLLKGSQGDSYLQMERRLVQGRFSGRDLNLVSSMASRVINRIDHLALNRRYLSMSQNAAIGVFTKMIAHDIKNYLTFAQYIDEKLQNVDEHPDIVLGVERAYRLALGMGNLTGSGSKPTSRISLPETAGGIMREFHLLFQKRCAFEAVVLGNATDIVSNEELLRRTLWNLVMNAFYAFGNRDPAISEPPLVRLRIEPKGKKNVIIRVEDNAGGIDSRTLDYLEKAFALVRDVYEREEDLIHVVETIYNMEGFTNRVGLFFTAVAVNDMWGTIAVTTEKGKGSVFTVQLPRKIDKLRDLLRF
ncbi:MAG: FHA domain-containing protein [Candidatus Abyssobacteria bacterium SURF_5]|uniref:FHA domain-containing protein n=1 Tax=Abyssobacteria bacterium (strain SURF_5) TaxID=2093360 RepID=A0A3A4NGA2_ABYX5|nr:MAG: FHA domain-containing protein [Candidatus Abyssubacteria bacterium SURF_5]